MNSGVWFSETITTGCNGLQIRDSSTILAIYLSDGDGFLIGPFYI